MVKVTTLDNGIRVIAKKLDGVKSLSMGVFVGVGSAAETTRENGLAHFIEHVNFKGTKKRTAFDISRDSESLGIMLNAATSKQYTEYYAKTISDHTETALEILADLFLDSVYPDEELEKEKGVVIEEINMYADTPDDVCVTELARAVFGDGSGYGKKILGTVENVSAFKRKDVLSFKKKYYTADKIVLSFVGDLDHDEIFALCEKYFSKVPRTEQRLMPARNTHNLCRKIVTRKDIEQEHVALGFSAPSLTDKDFDEYQIAVHVLGGGMSSRLFQKIREEMGLCYTVDAFIQPYTDCGAWSVYAGVKCGYVKKTIDAVINELRIIKEKGITEEEFYSIKEQIKSSIAFAEESTTALMNVYGKKLLFENAVYDANERMARLDKLSAKAVNDVIFNKMDFENYASSKVLKKR